MASKMAENKKGPTLPEGYETFWDLAAEMDFTKHMGGLKSTKELIDLCHINKETYVNISRLLKSLDLEKKIDFKLANEERKSLIDRFSKVLPKGELEDLVAYALSFKMNKVIVNRHHPTVSIDRSIDDRIDLRFHPKHMYHRLIVIKALFGVL